MKRKISKAALPGLVVQFAMLSQVTAFAGPLTVPNDFTSGTTASAAEVNANFSAVETSVNDNDARISDNATGIAANADAIANNVVAIQGIAGPIAVFDGGGSEIGLLVNLDDDNQFVDVLTGQGYILNGLELGSGQPAGLSPLFYASSDCSGQGYTDTPAGFVTMISDPAVGSALFYVDKNSIGIMNFPIGSSQDSGGCSAISGTMPFAWPALPNDPAITGISDQSYQLPIRIEHP